MCTGFEDCSVQAVQSMIEALQRIFRHGIHEEDARIVSSETAQVGPHDRGGKREYLATRSACLTWPGSSSYQALLPPSGTKNCVHVQDLSAILLAVFQRTTRRRDRGSLSPVALPPPRTGLPFILGGETFFLVKYDGLASRGDLADTRAISRSLGQIEAQDDEIRDLRHCCRPGRGAKDERRRRSSSSPTEGRARPVDEGLFPSRFPRGGGPREPGSVKPRDNRVSRERRLPECDRNAEARLYLGCKHRHFSTKMTLRQSKQLVHGYRAHRGRRGGVARAGLALLNAAGDTGIRDLRGKH